MNYFYFPITEKVLLYFHILVRYKDIVRVVEFYDTIVTMEKKIKRVKTKLVTLLKHFLRSGSLIT